MNSSGEDTLNTKEIIQETINEIATSYNLPRHNQKLAILVRKLFINQGKCSRYKR